MPRTATPLTAAQVKAFRFDGKASKKFDGKGLYLHIQESGKYWRLKYYIDGKERPPLALGVYPEVTLAEARTKRDEARELIRNGIDPAAHRRAERASRSVSASNSFEKIGREWLESIHKHSVVESHYARDVGRLENHVFPYVGRRPLTEISPGELLDALRRLERQGKSETAERVRGICSRVYQFAIRTGRAERDIAADLRGALRPARKRHLPAITDPSDLPALLNAIDDYRGYPTTIAALKLAPLVFVRPVELRKAEWDEFDLPGGVWNFDPAKKGRPLVTRLPRQAREILGELQALTGDEQYVFPSIRGNGRPMSENTINAALTNIGYKGIMTGHGFRATARTMLVERLGFPEEWVEQQLSHSVRDPLGRAYNRTTFVAQRGEMLQAWADYLDGLRDGEDPESLAVRLGREVQ